MNIAVLVGLSVLGFIIGTLALNAALGMGCLVWSGVQKRRGHPISPNSRCYDGKADPARVDPTYELLGGTLCLLVIGGTVALATYAFNSSTTPEWLWLLGGIALAPLFFPLIALLGYAGAKFGV